MGCNDVKHADQLSEDTETFCGCAVMTLMIMVTHNTHPPENVSYFLQNNRLVLCFGIGVTPIRISIK